MTVFVPQISAAREAVSKIDQRHLNRHYNSIVAHRTAMAICTTNEPHPLSYLVKIVYHALGSISVIKTQIYIL